MRVVAALIAFSIALNIWVLWKLHDQSGEPRSKGETASVSRETANTPEKPARTHSLPEISVFREELATLKAQLSRIEAKLEKSKQDRPGDSTLNDNYSNLSQHVQQLKSSVTKQERSEHSEDWFWNSPASEESAELTSIPESELYTVHSVACRSDWCRAEVQLNENSLSREETELELQLEVSEAMGRDVEMSFGDRTNNSQVIFIRQAE